jgi:hypothetical protein
MITVLGRGESLPHRAQIDKGENAENRRHRKYSPAGEISGEHHAVVSRELRDQ